jgi:hypothetical protein
MNITAELMFGPGEVDQSMPIAELIDQETQLLFTLQHHYNSSEWHKPAPAEGEVFQRSYANAADIIHSLGLLPAFQTLLPADGRAFASLGAYGLRTGQPDAIPPTAEWTISTAPHSTKPVVEAGIGFLLGTTGGLDLGRASVRIVLRASGEADSQRLSVRRYDSVGNEVAQTKAVRLAPDPEHMRSFLQLFREVTYHSVSEPI